ncbi:MAG: sulfotransferase [Myxococcota bacterium]|nr:sulfotransferase [Myxococcota bacterium]
MSLALRSASNRHRPGTRPNVFVFTTPRSGSTWLMEMIHTQPRFKQCSEPLDLRIPGIAQRLGISDWEALYQDANWPRIQAYFEGLCAGRIHFLNQSPFSPHYRPLTSRLLAKVLHGGEARIGELARACNARVVLLLRHPIPVSLSREFTPRLEAFLTSDYSRHFSEEEIQFAWEVVRGGSRLEKGVLDWCLQNAVPLRQAEEDWVVISYEELVLAPEPVLATLADRLQLEDRALMESGLLKPSATVRKSDAVTAEFLKGPRVGDESWWLVTKWREKVAEEEERSVMRILERFGIDQYRFGEVLPRPPLWKGESLASPAR